MITRPYRDDDFDAVLALVNEAAAADHTRRLPERILRAALAAAQASAPDAIIVEARGGGPVAFGWWEVRDEAPPRANLEGWVSPAYRRRGAGTALLTAAEAAIRGRAASDVTIGGRGYDDIPGLEPLFRLRGFSVVRRFLVMSVRLLEAEASADPPPGIVLRAFRRDDLEPLVEANNAIFAEHWGSAPRTVDSWRRDMIERRPYDPALWIVASTPEREGASQLVAECLSHASREGGPEDAWVSLVGVRREWRGRGLGRAVLAHGLRTLRDAGYATASLHVDAENTSAVNLYRSLGMDVTRTRLHFEKMVRG